MKIITLTGQQFDDYAINYPNRTTYQSSSYGRLMQKHGFMTNYIAFIDNNKEVKAIALILYKNIFKIFKYAYIPRGFLIDYNNSNLLKLFTIKLKQLLLIQGFIFIKIDPFIIYKERNKNNIIISQQNINIINSLKFLGYIHQGFNTHFETLKPRNNAIINLSNKKIEDLFLGLSGTTKKNIKKALKYGITIHRGEAKDIETLYNLTKDKHIRNLNYYLDYYNIFKENDMVDIYYAKFDPISYLNSVKKLYDKESEINTYLFEIIKNNGNKATLNKKIESDRLLNIYKKNIIYATELTKENMDGIIIAITLIINYDSTLYFLLDGHNPKYKRFNGNYLLKWLIINKYFKKGFKRINLNGISSNFNINDKYNGLNKFKLGFGSVATELIGEFDLPVNVFLYHFLNKFKLIMFYLSKAIRKD